MQFQNDAPAFIAMVDNAVSMWGQFFKDCLEGAKERFGQLVDAGRGIAEKAFSPPIPETGKTAPEMQSVTQRKEIELAKEQNVEHGVPQHAQSAVKDMFGHKEGQGLVGLANLGHAVSVDHHEIGSTPATQGMNQGIARNQQSMGLAA